MSACFGKETVQERELQSRKSSQNELNCYFSKHETSHLIFSTKVNFFSVSLGFMRAEIKLYTYFFFAP